MKSVGWKQIKSSLLARFVARGERTIASIGMAAAAILMAAMSASSWWSINVQQAADANAQQERLGALGMVLERSAQIMMSDGELTALRRLTIDSARQFHLTRCRITLGGDKILADADPVKINQALLPGKWDSGPFDSQAPVGPADAYMLRLPFHIDGKGTAFFELGAAPASTDRVFWEIETGVGLIGAAALGLLLLIYRRRRSSLAALDVIQDALLDYAESPVNAAALSTDARLGPVGLAWNRLLYDMEELRRQLSLSRADASGGGRRSTATGLESACDAMSQGLVLVDEQCRVRFANGAAAALLNAKRQNLAGTPMKDLILDEKLQQAIRAIASEKSRRPVTLELERQSEAGSGVLRFSVRPVRKGDAEAATIIIEDITQQRTAERARNSFITQVTHELRTPLTNIRMYAETAIEDGEKDPAVQSNSLNVINQESRRLERIVSAMLSVAEMEAGSCTIHKDDVHVDVLFNELKQDYQKQADEKKISLEFVLPPKLPVIQADRDRMAIAIHNLVGNALKYTPEGGKVIVTADVREGQLTIDVADTGIGIAADEVDRVFEKFTRSKDPRVSKIVGTGLGLTLAREVMRMHGGDVTVQSEPNRGSTFTARLPISAEAA